MKSLATQLIDIKDQIHTKWYELQLDKRSNGEFTFLRKPLLDDIIALGHQAVELLENVMPCASSLRMLRDYLHQAEYKSWIASDITHFGYLPYYVMDPQEGRDLITQDINYLANAIHRAGINQLKPIGSYCGCRLPEDAEFAEANNGSLTYCQGALQHLGGEGEKQAWLMPGGAKIEHRPGTARTHANVVEIIPTEKGYDVKMDYTESGDISWRDRQKGIVGAVNSVGGSCAVNDIFANCTINDAQPDDIRFIALMVSQLKDVDLMDSACIPAAMQGLTRQAYELNKLEPKETIYEQHWDMCGDLKEVMNCLEPKYKTSAEQEAKAEEDKEHREQIIYRRNKDWIEDEVKLIENDLGKVLNAPCIGESYMWADVRGYIADIRNSCADIKKRTIEPYGWCEDLADEKEAQAIEIAKGLVKRCPPEPIILGLEASNVEYKSVLLEQIEHVCQSAESGHCLDILKQVAAREEQGVKPLVLPMTYPRPKDSFKWDWEAPPLAKKWGFRAERPYKPRLWEV